MSELIVAAVVFLLFVVPALAVAGLPGRRRHTAD